MIQAYSKESAAKLLGITRDGIYKRISAGYDFPKPDVVIDRKEGWFKETILEWGKQFLGK